MKSKNNIANSNYQGRDGVLANIRKTNYRSLKKEGEG